MCGVPYFADFVWLGFVLLLFVGGFGRVWVSFVTCFFGWFFV